MEGPSNFTKNFFKQSSHYFIGTIFLTLSSLITFPIFTRILSVSDYGVLGLITVTISTVISISKFGLNSSAIRFYEECENNKNNLNLSQYYSTYFWGAVASGLIISILLTITLMVSENKFISQKLVYLMYMASFIVFLQTVIVVILNFFRAEQNTKLYNLVEILMKYASICTSIFFVFFFIRGLYGFYFGQILTLIVTLSLLIILYKNKILLKDFSFELFKKSLSYGLPLMGLEFLNHILTYADRYFINYYIGSERLGIYTVAYNLTSYLTNILLLPISLAIMPVLLESWSKKGPDETKLFLSKSLQYTLLLVFPVIVGFIIIRYDLIILLASSKYLESQRIIPFITLGVSFYILSNIFNAGLIIFKKTKIIMIFAGIASLINIGLNIILIPRFDLMGAAYATAISYFCFLIFIIISGWFYLSFKIKYVEITFYFIFSIVMAIIVNNIIIISPILSLSVKILVGIFIYSSLILIFDRNTRILVLKYFSK